MENQLDYEVLNQKAELLKALANPVRLCILKGLTEKRERKVNEMQGCLQLPQSTISQHLAKLRGAGVVKCRREGVEVFYQLVSEEVRAILRVLFLKS